MTLTKSKNSREKIFTPGDARYCSYYITTPDGDYKMFQTPINMPIDQWLWHNLGKTRLGENTEIAAQILKDGIAEWKETDGTTHRVEMEHEWRPNIRWKQKDGTLQ